MPTVKVGKYSCYQYFSLFLNLKGQYPLRISVFVRKRGRRFSNNSNIEILIPPEVTSVSVHRVFVLSPCFLIMTRLTKCLPVIQIPHQIIITTMRNDVVNDCCRNIQSFLHTAYTHWVLTEVLFTQLSPLAVVATLC